MSPRKSEIQDTIENRDRIHVVMFFLSLLFLALGAAIVVWIVKIQATYTVDDRVIGLFRPVVQKHVDVPVRGRILATDGSIMAIPYVPLLGLICFPLSQLQKSLLKENSLQSCFMITRFLKNV